MDLREIGWGVVVDSTGSRWGQLAGSCKCSDEPSGSGATELVSSHSGKYKRDCFLGRGYYAVW
jgi:hypothetical protein